MSEAVRTNPRSPDAAQHCPVSRGYSTAHGVVFAIFVLAPRAGRCFASPGGRCAAPGTRMAVTPQLARNLPPAGTSRPGCGRHRHCRRGPPGTSICRCARCRPGSSPRCGCRPAPSASSAMSCTVCGAWRSGEASTFQRPFSISAASLRIAIMASQNRSISAFDFRFGRLNHECARDRKAHGRGMEAVIDKPLGDIFDCNAALLLQRTDIDDAFVRHSSVRFCRELESTDRDWAR